MIAITGAYGFIGSCLASYYDNNELMLIDDFEKGYKKSNLKGFKHLIDRADYIKNPEKFSKPDFFIHIGARTDTSEFSVSIFNELNLHYSQKIWNYCTQNGIPLIYASSAATYGMGENGFKDNHDIISELNPLNPYGQSKQDFDLWVLKQSETPPFWAGLKFFNVYGPNEYHKGRMASVVFHAYNQIAKKGSMNLFRSHNPDYKDGEQKRDFVYIKDIISMIDFLKEKQAQSGIYNAGFGKARSFKDLALSVFKALDKEPKIEFIDTPIDIREKYQYFTEADMSKLISVGYSGNNWGLEAGIEDYVTHYLDQEYKPFSL